jgi:hypothetical protein
VGELVELVAECEALGFELRVWLERVEYEDRGIIDWVEHLTIRDPHDHRRKLPEGLLGPIMREARVIRGYLRRVRSPFWPDPATDGDRLRAMECSMADDRRLRQHGR